MFVGLLLAADHAGHSWHIATRFLAVLLITSAIGGCDQSHSPSSRAAAPAASAGSERTVDSFGFIGPGTTMSQVIDTLGAPDRDIGSGIHIYVYRLSNGTEVWIGSPDALTILYARNGATTLYEQK